MSRRFAARIPLIEPFLAMEVMERAFAIERDVAARSVRFTVQNQPPHAGGSAAGALPVLFTSLETPDLFKEGAEVVIEGRLTQDPSGSRFHADKVFAKCPSKFEGQAGATPGTPAQSS